MYGDHGGGQIPSPNHLRTGNHSTWTPSLSSLYVTVPLRSLYAPMAYVLLPGFLNTYTFLGFRVLGGFQVSYTLAFSVTPPRR